MARVRRDYKDVWIETDCGSFEPLVKSELSQLIDRVNQ